MTEIICIPNIKNYIQEIINDELILTPRENYIQDIMDGKLLLITPKKYITEDELNKSILKSSKILNCIVKNGEEIISNKTKYRSILTDVWKSMPTQKILQTTTFNIKLTNENGIDGYIWSPELKLSIQNKETKYTMKELLNMIKVNNYSIQISIQLVTGQIINFKF